MESAVYKDSNAVHLWLHLLMKCNHKDNEFIMNGVLMKVKRGEFVTGRKALSKDTGIQESKIERLLKLFENMQMIEQHTNNRNRRITVLSYDEYQSNEHQVNNTRTTGEQHMNTNNNDNNEYNDNNENNNPLSASPPVDKRPKYSDDDRLTAEWIFDRILTINPNNKKPNFDTWSNHIRLMREVDKRTHSEICKVFDWASKDNFWQSNILSTDKLRKQFDKLSIKMNQVAAPSKTLVDQSGFGDDDNFIDSHVIPNQPRLIENG